TFEKQSLSSRSSGGSRLHRSSYTFIANDRSFRTSNISISRGARRGEHRLQPTSTHLVSCFMSYTLKRTYSSAIGQHSNQTWIWKIRSTNRTDMRTSCGLNRTRHRYDLPQRRQQNLGVFLRGAGVLERRLYPRITVSDSYRAFRFYRVESGRLE